MVAVIPTGTRTAVLADLRRRRDNAMALLYAAEDAGDERKWRKATARFWLRELMLNAVKERPDNAVCAVCVWGETDWPQQGLLDAPALYSCLEHDTPRLERQAAEMAEQARWFGGAA